MDIKELAREVDALRGERECDVCEGKGSFAVDSGRYDGLIDCGGCNATGKKRDAWPRVVTELDVELGPMLTNPLRGEAAKGAFVKVRLAGSENEAESTHLGILLGDLPMGISVRIAEGGKMSLRWGAGNPAMWVPALKRIVMGCESWWSLIESPEELKAITDADIGAIPYVQAFAEMEGGEPDVQNAQAGVKRKAGDVH
jgi:hypothetical protein